MTQQLTDSVLRQTVTIASDAIICIDEAQRITFFNDGAQHIFGYSAEEVVGQPLDLLLPQRFRGAHADHVAGFGRSPVNARTMADRREISGVRKDGTEFPAEAAIAHVQTSEGLAYSVVLRDITERRRIEAVSAQLVRDLQSALAARDEVLGIVSHDLRNPVNAVKMLSSAILRPDAHGDLPPEVKEYASTMVRAAEQMDALIQDLLDVTRIESGRLQILPQAIPLATLVTRTFETLAPLAAEEGVALRSAIPGGLPPVDVDAGRVMQLLSNLVGNAIKYTPQGGSVTLSALRERDVLRVLVADTGVGILADELPRVFDRFWQSKRTNRSGAGLGLTIARGIVRGHGGRIWMESTPGEGTRVYFTLPIVADDDALAANLNGLPADPDAAVPRPARDGPEDARGE
ncbi:MAG TPA: PAS domain-containing sensor histidine kinase [Gemmatimonadaceae bacterium]|nr:PAS domain-containing sensor histidine kinase [Gemmatimonadaceae bacterium]